MGSVTVKIKPLLTVAGAFASLKANPSHPAFEAMFNQWTARYSAFTRRRYNRNSTGGGDWAPLAASTIAARKESKQSKSTRKKQINALARRGALTRGLLASVAAPQRSHSILKDTGVLFASLEIGSPGNSVKRAPGSVTYAIGGTGQRSVIARAHQYGNQKNKMPARPILVYPDQQTLTGLRRDGEAAVRKIIAGGGA